MSSSPVQACPACGAKNRTPIAANGRPRCAKCKSELPWIVPADDSDLSAALDTSSLVVLDLWAPWCGPCRMVAPVLEQMAKQYAGKIKVVKVNVDDSPGAAARYDARSIPTLVLIDRGTPVDRIVGAQPAPVMTQHIDKALAAR